MKKNGIEFEGNESKKRKKSRKEVEMAESIEEN